MRAIGAQAFVAALVALAITGCGQSAVCGRLKARAIAFGAQQSAQFQGIVAPAELQRQAAREAAAFLRLADAQRRLSCTL